MTHDCFQWLKWSGKGDYWIVIIVYTTTVHATVDQLHILYSLNYVKYW